MTGLADIDRFCILHLSLRMAGFPTTGGGRSEFINAQYKRVLTVFSLSVNAADKMNLIK